MIPTFRQPAPALFASLERVRERLAEVSNVERTIEDAQRGAVPVVPTSACICAWCLIVLRPGVQPVSHGICPACAARLEQEIA